MDYTMLIEMLKNEGGIYLNQGGEIFGKMLINAGNVIESLCEDNERLTNIIERINKPIKDAEGNYVITCKKCRYMQEAKVNKKGFSICPASGMEITDDDFCSYAERCDL